MCHAHSIDYKRLSIRGALTSRSQCLSFDRRALIVIRVALSSVFLSVHLLSVSLPLSLSLFLSLSLSLSMSPLSVSICLHLPPLSLPMSLSFCIPVCLPVCLFFSPSVSLSLPPPSLLFRICLSIVLFLRVLGVVETFSTEICLSIDQHTPLNSVYTTDFFLDSEDICRRKQR